MRGLRLRKAAVRLGLHGVDEVGELDRVLDEEDGDVVADDVPVALLRVELDREAADVAGEVDRALAAGDRGEPHERGRALARTLEQVGPREVGERLVVLEEPVGAVAAGVHDSLRNPLVVEVEDLLAEVEVLQQRRTSDSESQRVLVVADGSALLGREDRTVTRHLMRLTSGPGVVGQRGCGSLDGRFDALRLFDDVDFLVAAMGSSF